MTTVLSPSKRLNYSKSKYSAEDRPHFSARSLELIRELRKKSVKDLRELMNINDDLASLNYQRYQEFSRVYTENNSKPAILAFSGDVYLGLEADTMDKHDLNFAQKHVRILSGLYGILRPLDAMQAYRLEMGTSLKNKEGDDLYAFWGDKITRQINKALKEQQEPTLVNLASKEYFSVLDRNKIKGDVLDVHFREMRNGKLKFLSFNAKKARGLMTRFIIDNRIEKKEHLKGFDYEDYTFDEERSSENEFTFIR